MSPMPALKLAMQRPRRNAVAKAGIRSIQSSPELEVSRPVASLPRKPAGREAQSAIPAEQAFWESRSIAVCRVNAAGEVVRASRKFLEMIAVPKLEPGTRAAGLLEKWTGRPSVAVESIPLGANGETLLIFAFQAATQSGAGDDRSKVAFRLLHDSVAQSVAALAMNLFLVEQSGVTSHSPNTEKILRASLELVEQCAKEVRGICTLLQRQSKQAGLNCA